VVLTDKYRRCGQLCCGLFGLAILLTACEQQVSSPRPDLTVSVYEVGPPLVNRQAKFHGRVVPADLTKVAFRLPGKIELLAVHSGQQVLEGQVIARIDSSIQQQVLADSQAQFELSRRQLERASNLLSIGAITAARRDELNAGFRLASANLELAKAKLTYTAVTAPFAGTIVDVNKELFESVMPGETVATVYRNERIDVLFNIPDGLPTSIHQTDTMTAYNPTVTFSGRTTTHTMQYLKRSTARNPEVEAFQFWLTMPTPDVSIPPGVPATVTVDLNAAGFRVDSGLVVPLTALQAGADRSRFRVWRYQQGVVNPVAVSIARITREGALISSGLQTGDLLVTSSLNRLQTGQAVSLSARHQEP
jgi:RND family efflux transporter MFP subunit